MCPQVDNKEDDGQMMDGKLSLPLGEFYVSFTLYVYLSSKLTKCYINMKQLSTMAVGDASQATPVQITLVIMLCCSTQIVLYSFDPCKSLSYYIMCIN